LHFAQLDNPGRSLVAGGQGFSFPQPKQGIRVETQVIPAKTGGSAADTVRKGFAFPRARKKK